MIFLDTLPDSRTEINSTDKISPLLVLGIPNYSSAVDWRVVMDNVMDNGGQFDTDELIENFICGILPALVVTIVPMPFGKDVMLLLLRLIWYWKVSKLRFACQPSIRNGRSFGVPRLFRHFLLANVFCTFIIRITAKVWEYPTVLGPVTASIRENTERGSLKNTYEQIAADFGSWTSAH